ncbi:MAG TPA: glycosyl hydrolase family 28-related protein [Archangium sp.]|uniref:glycosyl hydrolase family 28-related protein n=1 Tax=Archangium sp. TaxID=1872627 RepID=UPI002E312791|nr:glycosyl hydrolase family 28-related protein [Archangium sp.]HEX5746034.1 glycosyl hydrolase family 28-related protein [Archangium sp.]
MKSVLRGLLLTALVGCTASEGKLEVGDQGDLPPKRVSWALTESDIRIKNHGTLPAAGGATENGRLARLVSGAKGLWMDNGLPVGSGGQWVHLFGEFRNVKDFGAAGDEILDDTAAIQAAINSLPNTGGIIFFPPGVYKVFGPIRIENSGVTLQGSGLASVIVNRDDMGKPALLVRGPASSEGGACASATPPCFWTDAQNTPHNCFNNLDGIVIRDLSFSHSNHAAARTAGWLVDVCFAPNTQFLNNYFSSSKAKGGAGALRTELSWSLRVIGNTLGSVLADTWGASLSNAHGSLITGNRVDGTATSKGNGLYLGTTHHAVISGNIFESLTTGVKVNAGSGITIQGYFEANKTSISVPQTGLSYPWGLSITGSIFDGPDPEATTHINLGSAKGVVVTGNRFGACDLCAAPVRLTSYVKDAQIGPNEHDAFTTQVTGMRDRSVSVLDRGSGVVVSDGQLRIMRGEIWVGENGTIDRFVGEGVASVVRTGPGLYNVHLTKPFAAKPTVVTSQGSSSTHGSTDGRSGWYEEYTSPSVLRIYVTDPSGSTFVDRNMIVTFVAMGPG